MHAPLKALILATAVGFAVSTVAIPAADAHPHSRYRILVCTKSKARNGTIIGGLGGALLGNAVAGHGNKTEGALLGGAVGAVAGHEIGKKKKKCHYEYRYR